MRNLFFLKERGSGFSKLTMYEIRLLGSVGSAGRLHSGFDGWEVAVLDADAKKRECRLRPIFQSLVIGLLRSVAI